MKKKIIWISLGVIVFAVLVSVIFGYFVEDVEIRNVKIDNRNAKLVIITHGPAEDCMAGCIWNQYSVVLSGLRAYKIENEPEIGTLLINRFGDGCGVNPKYAENNKEIETFITKKDNNVFWSYRFNNYSTEQRVRQSIEEYWRDFAGREDVQYCVLDGEIVITEISDNYAKKADTSNLRAEVKLLEDHTPASTEDLLSRCEEETYPEYCIEDIAAAKRDTSLCYLVKRDKPSMTEMFQESCIRSVAFWAKDKDICDEIKTESSRSQCYDNIDDAIEQEESYKE